MATNGVILINLGNRNSAEFDRILVPGSYEKALGAAIAGTYVTVYKWLYNGFAMTASLCTAEDKTDYISLVDKTNGGELMVYDDDTVTLVGAAIPVEPLNVTENGTYEATAPIRGFNPVSVDIPSSAPVINPISISENGTYTAPEGVDGYSPIVVDVEGGLITDIISLVDNKNVTSATGQTASVTTEEDYSAVAIVAFTVNTGTVLAPTLSISGGIQLTQDRIVDGFYYGRPYFILAHAFDVPSGTTISAASASNSASATLFVFGVAGGSSADLGALTAFSNGVYDAEDDDLDGYYTVTVETPEPEFTNIAYHVYSGDITQANASLMVQKGRYINGLFYAIGEPVEVTKSMASPWPYILDGIATISWSNGWLIQATAKIHQWLAGEWVYALKGNHLEMWDYDNANNSTYLRTWYPINVNS